MKRCEMLAVSGENGWKTGMSPPFMLRLGKSDFVVELAAQCFSCILQFAFSIMFIDRPPSGFSQIKFQGTFKNPFVGAPRTDDSKLGKVASAMGCSPHSGSCLFIDNLGNMMFIQFPVFGGKNP